MRQINGRRFLVTGATGSLGRATALVLYRMGAALVLPVRDETRGASLRRELEAIRPQGDTFSPMLELSDEASVLSLARLLLAEGKPLDGLILNAGVFTQNGRTSRHGNEWHMQVNCLSPLLLTQQLMPLLRLSEKPCVAAVTSLSAFWFHQNGKSPTRLYAASKRAMLNALEALSAIEPHIDFVYAHPGICATGLFRGRQEKTAYPTAFLKAVLPVMERIFPPPDKACRTILHALMAAKNGQLAEPGGFLHIWGKPSLVPLCRRYRDLK